MKRDPKLRTAVFATLLLLCTAAPAAANPLRVDRGFGDRGRVRASFGPQYKPLGFVSIQAEPDGSLLAARRDLSDNASVIRRYTASGRVDGDFKARLGSTPEVVDARGRTLRVAEEPSGSRLQRIEPDGTVDLSFGPTRRRNGKSAAAGFPIAAILPLPSGEIFVAGPKDEYETRLARFDADGKLDPSFEPAGEGALDLYLEPDRRTLAGLLPGPRGDVVVAVNSVDVEDEENDTEKRHRSVLAAFDREGDLDPAFGSSGLVAMPDSISTASALPGGAILVAGAHWRHRLTVGYGPYRHHASDIYVAELGPDGKPDNDFGGGDGIAVFDPGDIDIPRSLLISRDGSIIVGGATIESESRCQITAGLCKETPVLLRLKPNGSAAKWFADAGVSRLGSLTTPVLRTLTIPVGGDFTSAGVLALSETAGGELIAGGRSGPTGFLAALTRTGRPRKGFAKAGILTRHAPLPSRSTAHAVAMDAKGRTLVAASTTAGTLRDLDEPGGIVARYLPDGTLDRNFGFGAGFVRVPGDGFSAYALAEDADGGTFVLCEHVFGFSVVHLRANGSLERRFGNSGVAYLPLWMRPFGPGDYIRDGIAALPGGGVIVAGWNDERPQLVQLSSAGLPDPHFGSDGVRTLAGGRLEQSDVKRMAVTQRGQILLAGSVRAQRQESAHRQLAVIRLGPHGALDRRFGRNGIATPHLPRTSLARSVTGGSNGTILVAAEQSGHGRTVPVLLRLRDDGAVIGRSQPPTAGGQPLPETRIHARHLRQILSTRSHIFLLSQGMRSLLAYSARGRFEGAPRIHSRWEARIVTGAARNRRVVLAADLFQHWNFTLWAYRVG